MKDSQQNVNWNQTWLNGVEVWSSMKIMRKDDRGHKLMVQYSQMLVTIGDFRNAPITKPDGEFFGFLKGPRDN
jgi:hypothetical protein